jgi:hypothetical protein
MWWAAGALALLAGACGDDDDDGGASSDDPYVQALAQSMREDPDDLQLDQEQADCLAPRFVEILDPARLEEAGITPEQLADDDDAIVQLGMSEEEGGQMYDALGECDVDARALFLEGMTEDSGMSEEDRACLEEAIDDDFIRQLVAITLTQGEDALDGNDELTSQLMSTFAECPGALPDS